MLKFIISAIAGAGTYAIVAKILVFSKLIPILIGVAVFILVWRLLKSFFRNKEGKIMKGDMTPEARQAEKAAEEGMKLLMKMRNSTRMVKNNDAAKKIQDICKIGVDIFEDVKKNPQDLKKIKTFTNYYLDSTDKIITQYVELSGKKEITPEIQSAMTKVEALLDQIKETFEKQLKNLMEDDLLNLDVELSVLKKTMKYEG